VGGICVDTTSLVDLWRDKERTSSGPAGLLAAHRGEDFAVPAHAAGEFLEGGASISRDRLADSLRFLRLFRIGEVGVETALRYARIVAHLRGEAALAGTSKLDLWIAAWRSSTRRPSPPATSSTSGESPISSW
jgi:predicted nucleic acid-binding protein